MVMAWLVVIAREHPTDCQPAEGPDPMITFAKPLRSLGFALLLAVVALSSGMGFGVRPAMAVSPAKDKEVLWTQKCLAWERVTTPNKACVYGDRKSRVIVALVGDSHASHLFPAIEKVAKAHHWKLVVMVKVACGFLDMPIRNVALGRTYSECATWNKNVVKRLGVLRPALTIVVNSRRAIHPTRAADRSNKAKGKAVARMIAKVPGRVALIVDSPVARQPNATYLSLGAIEKVAAKITGDRLISLTSATCSRWPCPSKVGSITKFRDYEHFTATFSRTVLGKSGGALDRALGSLLS
jgi:SGNH domain-containing protein